jgi:alpha-tubulin suppressor-like RCC1 family protein
MAIKTDGGLWAWGWNGTGQLGIGTSGSDSVQYTPVRVGSDNNWASIVTGSNHTVGVRTDSSLWAWGNNSLGALGLGDTENRNVPVRVGSANDWVFVAAGQYHQTLAIKTDGSLWACGPNGYGQLGVGTTTAEPSRVLVQVGTDKNWAMASGGSESTFAMKSDGTLWRWGLNLINGVYGHSTSPTKL